MSVLIQMESLRPPSLGIETNVESVQSFQKHQEMMKWFVDALFDYWEEEEEEALFRFSMNK